MSKSRRKFLKAVGAVSAVLTVPDRLLAESAFPSKKRRLVTLSFDDGFKKSCLRTAEIYEKYKLSA